MFSKKTMDVFREQKNIGFLKDADAVGKVGNPSCGDIMWVYIKVGKNDKGEKVITDVKAKTFGCVAAIATASAVGDMAKGKTLEEAEKISMQGIAEALDGLPPEKMHCSALAQKGLKAAIEEYKNQKKQ